MVSEILRQLTMQTLKVQLYDINHVKKIRQHGKARVAMVEI